MLIRARCQPCQVLRLPMSTVHSPCGRILRCMFLADQAVILTNGFAKKAQKTPSQEIKLAEQRKQDYLLRKREEG